MIKTKIKIDKEKCIGCGVCENICPNGFKIVNGKAEIIDENAECVEKAVSSCPTNAIIVIEDKKNSEKDINVSQGTNIGAGRRGGMSAGLGHGAGRGMGRGLGVRRGGGMGLGPGGYCVCPKCGYRIQHRPGSPCYQQKCPKCGTPMTRE